MWIVYRRAEEHFWLVADTIPETPTTGKIDNLSRGRSEGDGVDFEGYIVYSFFDMKFIEGDNNG